MTPHVVSLGTEDLYTVSLLTLERKARKVSAIISIAAWLSVCLIASTIAAQSNLRPNHGDNKLALDNVNLDDESGQKQADSPPVRRSSSLVISRRAIVEPPTTAGMFASWEPCARAIETERKDFGEFVVSLLCASRSSRALNSSFGHSSAISFSLQQRCYLL